MKGTYGMLETGMLGTGINFTGQSQLLDPCEALDQRILHDVEQYAFGDLYKSENRIVDDFTIVQ